jgi:hypothetical protein
MYMPLSLDYDLEQDGDICPVVVRMPAKLREAVKAKAASEERSMAQAIRFALRQYVAQE